MLLGAVLAAASGAQAQTVVYSQTSLAASSGREPGLFDQLGVLAGPSSQRRDFYEIFTNTGAPVQVNKVTLFGSVDTPATAVFVPVIVGMVNGVADLAMPDTDANHVLSSASVPTTGGLQAPWRSTSPRR